MKVADIISSALVALLMANFANGQASDAPGPAATSPGSVASGRITYPPPEEMNADQRAEYDRSIKNFGVAGGPRLPLTNSPEVLAAWSQMGDALSKSELPEKLREIAIIVVGACWKSEFEWYVHAGLAQRAGVAPAAVEAIRVGKKPQFTTPEEETVYRYAYELVNTHQVSDDAYAAARKLLGTRTLVDLTVLLGHYTSVSMTLNAHRVPLPNGVKPSF